jgi:hypothetical protein
MTLLGALAVCGPAEGDAMAADDGLDAWVASQVEEITADADNDMSTGARGDAEGDCRSKGENGECAKPS